MDKCFYAIVWLFSIFTLLKVTTVKAPQLQFLPTLVIHNTVQVSYPTIYRSITFFRKSFDTVLKSLMIFDILNYCTETSFYLKWQKYLSMFDKWNADD